MKISKNSVELNKIGKKFEYYIFEIHNIRVNNKVSSKQSVNTFYSWNKTSTKTIMSSYNSMSSKQKHNKKSVVLKKMSNMNVLDDNTEYSKQDSNNNYLNNQLSNQNLSQNQENVEISSLIENPFENRMQINVISTNINIKEYQDIQTP